MSFQYTSGDPSHLTGGANASMADIQGPFTDLRTFLNARIAAIPTLVSSLPVSPVDAQEIYYQADATNGIVWHLRYRAASASAFKWEFVGGSEMFSAVDTEESVTLAAYGNPATPGPDVTVPLAGDYLYVMEAHVTNNTTNVTQANIGLSAGGVAPVANGPDTAQWTAEVAATGHGAELHRSNRKTGLAASTLLRVQYLATTQILVRNRRLRVRPIRVG